MTDNVKRIVDVVEAFLRYDEKVTVKDIDEAIHWQAERLLSKRNINMTVGELMTARANIIKYFDIQNGTQG